MFIIAGGRKSKYHTHVKPRLEEIQSWREKGESEKIIAKKLGVAMSTFSEYKLKFPEFAEILQHSKVNLVNNLKKALWKEAMGFEHVEEKTGFEKVPVINKMFIPSEPISEDNPVYVYKNKIKTEKTKKYNRSQANLLMFALCNLCPEEFKRVDKEEVSKLEEELKERQNIITDNKIQDAFNKLYGSKKEEVKKDDKNKETEKAEDS